MVGASVELDVIGVDGVLVAMYWAIRSDSSKKLISSSYEPIMAPASGSHLQSERRSTAEGVKH